MIDVLKPVDDFCSDKLGLTSSDSVLYCPDKVCEANSLRQHEYIEYDRGAENHCSRPSATYKAKCLCASKQCMCANKLYECGLC